MFKKMFELSSFERIHTNIARFLGKYTINDPTTPSLVEDMTFPKSGLLKYGVKGFNPVPKNEDEVRAVNCHISVGNCIEKVQNQLKSPVKNWAATSLLQVIPAAGSDLNAYYDRASLRFFYYRHDGKNYYFGDSQDIVTHELGHAILDAMRPDFWSVQSLEIWSFHEAFSDIVAMFNMMNYEVALAAALKENNGDLRKSNVISRLAEEVGVLINKISKDRTCLPNSLRDPTLEKFKYINPSNLPKDAPNNQLAAECHSFGRVFSAAWYEIFVRIYEQQRSLNVDPLTAAKTARDVSFSIMTQAIPNTGRVVDYFSNVAMAMTAVASSKGATYAKIVNDVFVEWGLIKNENVRALSDISWKNMARNLKKNDNVFKNSKITTVCIKGEKLMKASELSIVSGLSLGGDFEIEVPNDKYYEFDNKGNLVAEIGPDETHIKESATACLLGISNSIGKGKMWYIENNRLKRRFLT
jgi:hypothetical protein